MPAPQSLAFHLAAEKAGGDRALRKLLKGYRRTHVSYDEISRRLHADGIASVTAQTVNTWCRQLGIENGDGK